VRGREIQGCEWIGKLRELWHTHVFVDRGRKLYDVPAVLAKLRNGLYDLYLLLVLVELQ